MTKNYIFPRFIFNFKHLDFIGTLFRFLIVEIVYNFAVLKQYSRRIIRQNARNILVCLRADGSAPLRLSSLLLTGQGSCITMGRRAGIRSTINEQERAWFGAHVNVCVSLWRAYKGSPSRRADASRPHMHTCYIWNENLNIRL